MKKIVGHRENIEMLTAAAESGKLAHAYLFSGPEGIGKKLTALELARSIVGSNNERYEFFFDEGIHPDFISLSPEEGSIKTEAVSELIKFFSAKPSYAEKKIALIDEAEKMNLSAQNKILKLIEEPPAYALFFLITSKKDEIIPTLKSRLINVNFNLLSAENIEEYCAVNEIRFDREAAASAQGSIKSYIELGAEEGRVSERVLANALIKAVLEKNYSAVYETLTDIEKNCKDRPALLNFLEAIINNKIIADNMDIESLKRYNEMQGKIANSRNRLNNNQRFELIIWALAADFVEICGGIDD